MLFTKRDTLTSPSCRPLISFSFLLVLNSTSILKKNQDSRHPCLFHDFTGIASSFSSFGMRLVVGFSSMILLCWSIFSLTLHSLGLLSWKHVEFLSKSFSSSIEMVMWFLSLSPFMWTYVYLLMYVEPPLQLWYKDFLVMVDKVILLMYVHIQFVYILLRIFQFIFIKDIGL